MSVPNAISLTELSPEQKEKDALKISKNSAPIQKKSTVQNKDKKVMIEKLTKSMDIDETKPVKKSMGSNLDNIPKRERKYVTEGLPDYVTMLKSRQSGAKLRAKMILEQQLSVRQSQ